MKKSRNQQGIIVDGANEATEAEKERRRKRFAVNHEVVKNNPIHRNGNAPIVGQCQVLEKAYFRLTNEVDPAKVRPEPVLKEAFARLKKIWKESNRQEYVLDQLKAIRQDLVVQGIHNEFTVKVYEYNVKRAILCKNLNELNQCQTMLTTLYRDIPSKRKITFLAYNILYDAIMNNTIDLHHHLVVAQKHLTERPVQHALLVVRAIRNVDYIYYVKLIATAPKYSRVLMEIHLPTMQRHALKSLLCTFFPTVEVAQLAAVMQISSNECMELLRSNGITATDIIDLKANRSAIQLMSF